MSGLHPSLTAAVAHEHRQDLMRAARRARQARLAAAAAESHHRTERLRPAWWTRLTTRVTVSRVAPTGA